MTNRINQWFELMEQDIPPLGGQPDMGVGGPPQTQPSTPGDPGSQTDPVHQHVDMQPGEDISDDPQFPDMPEEKENDSFEVWKRKYFKESIKGDPNTLLQKILEIRDRELDAPQKKFLEDNLDINQFRLNSNILMASNELRKRIKKDFDRTNPATSVVGHMSDVLAENTTLNEIYIKMTGLSGGSKMDAHRKFVAAMTGSVQVGSGGQNEDLVFEESDYSIRISTRLNSKWGDVNIGRWYLQENDPEKFLKEAELQRLEGGSPEEKDVLRRRIVIESIAQNYMERAFIITVVGNDGTVQHLGWDLGNSLKSAFLDGKLVVRTGDNDNKEAFIDESGSIIAIPTMTINYIKESGDLDDGGKANIEEVEFMRHKDGVLFLCAPLSLVKEASVSLQGIVFKESLWSGNPADFLRVQRCVPGLSEMLLRQC